MPDVFVSGYDNMSHTFLGVSPINRSPKLKILTKGDTTHNFNMYYYY